MFSKISLVMGSFLFIDWANIRLLPSKISVKKLSEQGLIFRENVCCTIVPLLRRFNPAEPVVEKSVIL